MSKKFIPFEVMGKTPEGLEVVNNVFRCYGTMGVPLFLILSCLKEHNKMPDWVQFYVDAKNDGWNKKTILNKLRDEMSQVYDDNFTNMIIGRLDKLFIEGKKEKGRIFCE